MSRLANRSNAAAFVALSPAALILAAATLAAGPGCGDTPNVSVNEMNVSVMNETAGVGKKARDGDIVCVDYRVRIPDGEELMWDTHFCFELGAGAVIAALDETVPGMQRGGSREVMVPAHKHWGRAGYGGKIPERTPLVLEVKLVEID
jgi:FKBP-type peptidyl-prolyl cis-trans isomerase FkpA